uniref:Major facilitator superfamily (MFS) profile domain-containing protein n=1 Tax=Chlamydomonas leiostraca TaxID=1034604 RepID=A0A7S0WQM3_9CHLO|mmetsp:Transcript_23923/g.60939  ORF Transcript_23923/g.60939 Transcript_23923/m.60939 type:complete len:760 (+) Transcript_23923:116-2395(+)
MAIDIDDVLEHHVGAMGRGQVLMLVVASMSFLPMGVILVLMVFTALDPVSAGHWACTAGLGPDGGPLPACATLRAADPLPSSLSKEWCALPPGSTRWTFARYSVISTYGLTCGRAWQVTLLNSMYFIGLAAGGMIFGVAADKWGRRPALYASTLLAAVTTLAGALAPTFWLHFIPRTLSAVGVQGMVLADIIIVTEPVGPSCRGRAGVITQSFFILGELLLAALAAALPDWRALSVVAAGSAFAFLATALIPRCVHESPRWLLAHGRKGEAVAVLKALAAANRRVVEPWVWEQLAAGHVSHAHHGDVSTAEGSAIGKGETQQVAESEAAPLLPLKQLHSSSSSDDAQAASADNQAASDGWSQAGHRCHHHQQASGGSSSSQDGMVVVHVSRGHEGAGQAASRRDTAQHQGQERQEGQGRSLQEERAALLSSGHGSIVRFEDSSSQSMNTGWSSLQVEPGSKAQGPHLCPAAGRERSQADSSSEDKPGCTRQNTGGRAAAASGAEAAAMEADPLEAVSGWEALRESPHIRRYAAVLSFALMACVLAYYGANFSVGSFSGSQYVNFALLALAEAPGSVLEAALIDVAGRCLLMTWGLVAAAAACVACGLVPASLQALQVGLAMVGKLGSSVAWCVLLVYAAEVLPTSCRSTLSGAISQAGRVGGVCAPYLFLAAGRTGWSGLPFLVMGAWSGVAALVVALTLPETCGLPQPERLADLGQLAAEGRSWWGAVRRAAGARKAAAAAAASAKAKLHAGSSDEGV